MRVVIVDDHVLFREGLAAILHEPDIEVVGLAGDVAEAVDLARQLRPDIILMDFNLPDGTGADATRRILSEHPQCKIVFLTISEEDENLFAAIRSGAKGYLLKNMRPSKLVMALRAVQQGESALSRSMTMRLMEELSHSSPTNHTTAFEALPHTKLTRREQDVLSHLADGMTNQEIAARLFLSENTVKYHVHSILDKLDLTDRKAAAVYAREHGLVR